MSPYTNNACTIQDLQLVCLGSVLLTHSGYAKCKRSPTISQGPVHIRKSEGERKRQALSMSSHLRGLFPKETHGMRWRLSCVEICSAAPPLVQRVVSSSCPRQSIQPSDAQVRRRHRPEMSFLLALNWGDASAKLHAD